MSNLKKYLPFIAAFMTYTGYFFDSVPSILENLSKIKSMIPSYIYGIVPTLLMGFFVWFVLFCWDFVRNKNTQLSELKNQTNVYLDKEDFALKLEILNQIQIRRLVYLSNLNSNVNVFSKVTKVIADEKEAIKRYMIVQYPNMSSAEIEKVLEQFYRISVTDIFKS